MNVKIQYDLINQINHGYQMRMLTYLVLQNVVIDLFIVSVIVFLEDPNATFLHLLQKIRKHNTLLSSIRKRIFVRELTNESSECNVSWMSFQFPPPATDDVHGREKRALGVGASLMAFHLALFTICEV
jgi:hypothetical protein